MQMQSNRSLFFPVVEAALVVNNRVSDGSPIGSPPQCLTKLDSSPGTCPVQSRYPALLLLLIARKPQKTFTDVCHGKLRCERSACLR